MEIILAGILMLAPAIFIVLLIAGGIIMAGMWIYAHLQHKRAGKRDMQERRSGMDRRHAVMESRTPL